MILQDYIAGFSHFVSSMTVPIVSGRSNIAWWVSLPLENAALARRAPKPVIPRLQKTPLMRDI